MPFVVDDRVAETTTVSGTGPVTPGGALTGYKTFAAAKSQAGVAIASGDLVPYAIEEVDSNFNPIGAFEVGIGTWNGTTVTRTTVLRSSNADALVNFAAGTSKIIYMAPSALRSAVLDQSSNLWLPDSLADPGPPTSGITLFVRARAGRRFLTMEGPSGVDNVLQPQLWGNRVSIWSPGSGTAVGSFGGTPTTAATLSHPTPAITTLAESLHRTRFSCSTTAGNASGARDALNTVWRGNASGAGGFFSHTRFASGSISLAGGQKIIGLSSSTAALGAEPSALADAFAMIKDSTDTNWQFVRRTGTGTAQKVNLGVAVANNQTFDLTMFSAPNGTGIGVRIVQFTGFSTSTVLLDTVYTDNLPASATLLGRHFQVRNGATAAADNLDLVRWYLESDF